MATMTQIQRQQAKAQAAYQAARYVGRDPRNSDLDVWMVPSESEPGVARTVAIDRMTGYSHCDCPHGRNGGRGVCAHRLGVARREDERLAQEQVRQAADRLRDTAPLRRSNQPFSLLR